MLIYEQHSLLLALHWKYFQMWNLSSSQQFINYCPTTSVFSTTQPRQLPKLTPRECSSCQLTHLARTCSPWRCHHKGREAPPANTWAAQLGAIGTSRQYQRDLLAYSSTEGGGFEMQSLLNPTNLVYSACTHLQNFICLQTQGVHSMQKTMVMGFEKNSFLFVSIMA